MPLSRVQQIVSRCSLILLLLRGHDSDAPASVGARQTPFAVRILCTLFDTGSTQAASFESRVVRPSGGVEVSSPNLGWDRKVAFTWLNSLKNLLLGIELGKGCCVCHHNADQ